MNTNLVQRISAEHKLINKYIVTIERMMVDTKPDMAELFSLMELMKTDIRTHFKIEETLFFNVSRDLLPDSCRDIIMKLTLEHRTFLKEIDEILEGLSYRIKNKTVLIPPLKEKIISLIESIKQHARIELTELFPNIEKNTEAKQAVLKKLLELTKT